MQKKNFLEVGKPDGVRKILEAQSTPKPQSIHPDPYHLIAELHRKETVLAQCTAELELLQLQLQAEVEKREKAQAEIVTLNDQSDAYTEELMHLQAENARLEIMLQEAEAKAHYAISGGRPNREGDDASDTSEDMEILEAQTPPKNLRNSKKRWYLHKA